MCSGRNILCPRCATMAVGSPVRVGHLVGGVERPGSRCKRKLLRILLEVRLLFNKYHTLDKER